MSHIIHGPKVVRKRTSRREHRRCCRRRGKDNEKGKDANAPIHKRLPDWEGPTWTGRWSAYASRLCECLKSRDTQRPSDISRHVRPQDCIQSWPRIPPREHELGRPEPDKGRDYPAERRRRAVALHLAEQSY